MTEESLISRGDSPQEDSIRPSTSNRSGRPRRHSVGGASGRLTVNGVKDPNFEYRFVNDTGNRIQEMREFGYEIVEDRDIYIGTSNPKQSGTRHEAINNKRTGEKSVLMRQPKEFHDEDIVLRAEVTADTESSMLRDLKDPDEGRYGSVSIQRDGT